MIRTPHRLSFITTFLVGMLIGIALLALISAGEIYDYQDSVDGADLPQVDAIVVLAGGRGRLSAAGDLWYRYWEKRKGTDQKPPLLYLSGMGPTATWSVFGRQVREGVREIIRADDVVIERDSTNTEENIRFLLIHSKKRKWKRILLMTSSYHMKRSLLLLERLQEASDVQLEVDSLTILADPFEPEEWRTSLQGIRVTLNEYLKWLYYRYFWSI